MSTFMDLYLAPGDDIVLVKCNGHDLGRKAKIKAIQTNNKYEVKFLGRKKVDGDGDYGTIEKKDLTRYIDDFLAYYEKLSNDDPDKFEKWYDLVSIMVLLQPSSASAERVFSMLAQLFHSNQERMLQVNIWIVLALKYADRRMTLTKFT